MSRLTVSNQTQLLSALSAAKGGDTILLRDGNYGAVQIKKDFSSPINIVAENPLGAVFDKIEIRGGSNLAFDGIRSTGEFRAWYSAEDITVTNSKVSQFYFSAVDGLTIDRSESADGYFNLILNSVQNFKITNSYFHGATEDVSRVTGNSYNGLFENNAFTDVVSHKPLHADLMQFFGAKGVTPHDIIIRGNLFWDNTKTGGVPSQGIFMADANTPEGYRNILIEENLIAARHVNTVYINGGQENVVVRHNTLLATSEGHTAVVRLAKGHGYDNSGVEVYGNAMVRIVDETKSSDIHDNLLYGRIDPATIFQGNDGSKWEDFLPREGSVADFGSGYGALGRLSELLGRENANPPPEASNPPAAPELVYAIDKEMSFSGRIDGRVQRIADREEFHLDEGTIAFDFKADTIGWRRGLVARDSIGKGDDFGVWIDNGTLFVRFGDGEQGTPTLLSVGGLTAKTDYDFVASFDEDGASAWLNGRLIGTADLHMDWTENHETLLIGAENALSTSGTTDAARYAYDGKLGDLAIYDQAMTPDELQAHLSAQTLV